MWQVLLLGSRPFLQGWKFLGGIACPHNTAEVGLRVGTKRDQTAALSRATSGVGVASGQQSLVGKQLSWFLGVINGARRLLCLDCTYRRHGQGKNQSLPGLGQSWETCLVLLVPRERVAEWAQGDGVM
jgi:hypothetical protein